LLPANRHERWPGDTLKNQEEAMLSTLARALSIRQIKRVVAAYYDVEVGEIESHCRTARIVHIRHVAMYLTKVITGRSLPEIGRHFGRRDHTTVLHACRKIERVIERDEDTRKAIDQLKSVLRPQARD
jgi:chromosomal replication initiator protein